MIDDDIIHTAADPAESRWDSILTFVHAGFTPIFYSDPVTNTASVNAGDYNLNLGVEVCSENGGGKMVWHDPTLCLMHLNSVCRQLAINPSLRYVGGGSINLAFAKELGQNPKSNGYKEMHEAFQLAGQPAGSQPLSIFLEVIRSYQKHTTA